MSNTNASIEGNLGLAVEHHRAGRLSEAERLYRAVIQTSPRHPEANHNLGRIALDAGRGAEAMMHLKTALEADPTVAHVWLGYIDALIRIGQPAAARQILNEGTRRGLAGVEVTQLEQRLVVLESRPTPSSAPLRVIDSQKIEPRSAAFAATQVAPGADEINALTALFKREQYAEVESLARSMCARFPQHPFGWKLLGSALQSQQRAAEALEPLTTAARLAPADSETHANLGSALEDCGRLQEAEAHLRAALQIDPDDADVLNNLGVLLARTDRSRSEAEACFRQAIRRRRDFPAARNNLGLLFQETGRLIEAEGCFRDALQVQPDDAGVLCNLARVLRSTGRRSDAEASLRRAIEIEPGHLDAYSNLLFGHNYTTRHSPQACLEEARRYGQLTSRKAHKRYSSWPNALTAGRLRVGIVSGDLREHPVGRFLENLLAHVDASRFEVIAFPTHFDSDTLTARIRSRCAGWVPLYGLTDRAAAHLIHRDGIQVLFDLSGHTAHNRLPLFAWKPAPVQVSWLGYFATTGVAQIDYVLADEHSVPLEHHDHFTEAIWYLPETRLCFTPPESDIPVTPLPALANGYVTFGNFQNLAKLGGEVLALWGQIMSALPDARLRLQIAQLADPSIREQIARRLRHAGIAVERVSLHGPMPRGDYLAAHAEVDFVLDSFPYPGGTTTCEALWMGVPTLTLAGDRLIARQGASLLTAAGLPEWVANRKAEYVDKARAFARAIPALAALRRSLRAQVLQSPLFDAPRFARNFENALSEMWRQRRPD